METLKFVQPFTTIFDRPTMSGKSSWIKNLQLLNAQLIYPAPQRVLLILNWWQSLYDGLKHWIPNIQFIEGIKKTSNQTLYQELRSYPWHLPRRHSKPEEKFPSCSECGTLFSSSYDLQRHARKGCPMEQSDNYTSEDDNDEDDDDGFIPLVNEVWEENHS